MNLAKIELEEIYYATCREFANNAGLEAVAKAARKEALEEAAKAADCHECGGEDDIVCQHLNCATIIAAAIRKLI